MLDPCCISERTSDLPSDRAPTVMVQLNHYMEGARARFVHSLWGCFTGRARKSPDFRVTHERFERVAEQVFEGRYAKGETDHATYQRIVTELKR